MKYLCDSCSRLVDVSEYTLRSGGLVLICPVCKMESSAGPPAPRRNAPVIELARPKPPPEGPFCPKCGAPHPAEQPSCAKCGLTFALFNPEHLALPAPLEETWTALVAAWSDAARHEAFLEECHQAGVLIEAARRYRVRSEQDPGDSAAALYRDEAGRRLMALTTLPHEEEPDLTWVKVVMAGVVVVACLALVGVIFYKLTHPV